MARRYNVSGGVWAVVVVLCLVALTAMLRWVAHTYYQINVWARAIGNTVRTGGKVVTPCVLVGGAREVDWVLLSRCVWLVQIYTMSLVPRRARGGELQIRIRQADGTWAQPSLDSLGSTLYAVIYPTGDMLPLAYFARLDGQWTVIFRGTEELSDVMADLQYDLAPFPPISGTHAHAGWVRMYMSIRRALHDTFRALRIDDVLLYGHSLGASMAALVAADLPTGVNRVRLYRSGAPRCYDLAFQNALDLRVPDHTVVNSLDDLVPTLPPPSSPNPHDPETPYLFHTPTQTVLFSRGTTSNLTNHVLSTYGECFRSF